MRDFGFKDTDAAPENTSAANIAGIRPAPVDPEPALLLDEPVREPEGLRPLNATRDRDDDDDGTNNTAKIVGGVLVGLLLVGGGIYAYESTYANTQPQQQMALKTPSANHVATDQYPTSAPVTPDSNVTPAATPPVAPTPSHRTVRAAENDTVNSAAADTGSADAGGASARKSAGTDSARVN